jgi:Uri superfamily endonuclease
MPISQPIAVHSLGSHLPRGAYIMRIDLSRPNKLSFGRFKGGKRVELNAGSYLYIGSTSLAHRVRRRTRRSGSRPTHRIDTALVQHLHNIALLPTPAAALTLKNLHWNVDYLLDLPTATLTAIYLLHSTANIEKPLAGFFSRAREATVFERRLGANDAPGHTHLLYISADSEWWRSLNYRLSTEFYEE